MKKGWVFTYGVDGFGADIAPAHEYGVYLDYDKAFKKLCKLNSKALKESDNKFYESGYGEDYYPDDNMILEKAEQENDWETYDKELKKHILTDIKDVCKKILEMDCVPYGFYSMEQINIHE